MATRFVLAVCSYIELVPNYSSMAEAEGKYLLDS